MPNYTYRARKENGQAVKGSMEAASEEELAAQLRKMGYMPTTIAQAEFHHEEVELTSFTDRFKRIKLSDIIIFNLQLANLLDSGVTLLSSLNVMSRQIQNKRFREIIEDVSKAVSSGSSFSDALATHAKIFPPLFIHMVRAGELSGNLSTVLNRYSQYIDREDDLRQKIKGALFYPMILLGVGIGVIVLIVSFVLPQFIEIFNKADVALPLSTLALHKLGLGIKNYWYVFGGGTIAAIFLIRWYVKTPLGRSQLDRLVLRIPIIGKIARQIIISRMTRTLGILIDSGVPILQSLDVLKDVVGNVVFRNVIGEVRENVEKGEKIMQSLRRSNEFPPDVLQMVSVGEESGRLAPMLNKVADFYDKTIEYSLKKLITLIEPTFITIMGCLAGFIMASMILPLFDMIKTIKS